LQEGLAADGVKPDQLEGVEAVEGVGDFLGGQVGAEWEGVGFHQLRPGVVSAVVVGQGEQAD
jgi:hypothetical protein